MADIALRRISALKPVYREGVYGAAREAPGIVIRERRGLLLRVVRGDPGVKDTTVTALSLAPGEWLLASPENATAPALDTRVVVDVSHGRTVLRLCGNDARRLLMKGCTLDLHPAVFAVGACAQTAIARINVLIHRVGDGDEDAYDLYGARSTARSLWHWITQGAAEFGYRVGPPLREGETGY